MLRTHSYSYHYLWLELFNYIAFSTLLLPTRASFPCSLHPPSLTPLTVLTLSHLPLRPCRPLSQTISSALFVICFPANDYNSIIRKYFSAPRSSSSNSSRNGDVDSSNGADKLVQAGK